MMPRMHLRIIEHIFKRAKRNINIRVIEMSDAEGHDMHQEKILNAKANHSQWNVFQRPVHYIFHPVKPEMGSKPHLFYRVMYFVKLPKKRNPMEQSVNIPMNKIAQNKQG